MKTTRDRQKTTTVTSPIGVELEVADLNVSLGKTMGEKMKKRSKRSLKSLKSMLKQKGLTTVEYAVAGGLIALVVVGAFQALGLTVGGIITDINTLLP